MELHVEYNIDTFFQMKNRALDLIVEWSQAKEDRHEMVKFMPLASKTFSKVSWTFV